MKARNTVLAAAAAALAEATTIHLCGDSTTATWTSGAIQGWGAYLPYSFDSSKFTINNAAKAGRSARSYTREGRFDAVLDVVEAGDWVVIEFGHNDGGSLATTDNGRSDCYGDGDQTCQTTYDGVSETVLTYPAYLKKAGAAFLAAGAKVIIASPTPDNVWQSGTFSWGPDRFFYYSWLAASQLGGTSAGAYFVPHGAYAAQIMKSLGADVVNANYPQDHTHTSPYLADYMAGAFVLGLTCGTSDLGKDTVNSTASLTAKYGGCLTYNATVPI